MLKSLFVGDSKFFTAFFPAGGKHPASIGRSHTLTESVFVLSFSAGRLICTFHGRLKLRAAKMDRIFLFTKVLIITRLLIMDSISL